MASRKNNGIWDLKNCILIRPTHQAPGTGWSNQLLGILIGLWPQTNRNLHRCFNHCSCSLNVCSSQFLTIRFSVFIPLSLLIVYCCCLTLLVMSPSIIAPCRLNKGLSKWWAYNARTCFIPRFGRHQFQWVWMFICLFCCSKIAIGQVSSTHRKMRRVMNSRQWPESFTRMLEMSSMWLPMKPL